MSDESTASAGTFECPGCARKYKWRAELAGKKVKCKCGQVLQCPAEDPAASADDGLYGFADDDAAAAEKAAPKKGKQAAPADDDSGFRCPSCGGGMEVGTVICVQCGYNMKTKQRMATAMADHPAASGAKVAKGKGGTRILQPAVAGVAGGAGAANPMLGYAGTVKRRDEGQEADRSAITELYVPMALVVAGLILSVVKVMHFDEITVGFRSALILVGMQLAIDFVLLAIGCLAVVRLLDAGFGAPGPAALKIAAIALIGAPVGEIVGFLIHDPIGIMKFMVGLIVISGLLYWLFDLEYFEISVLTTVVGLVRMWAGYAILGLILHGMGMSIGSIGAPGLSDAQVNSDRRAREIIDMGTTSDAKSWLAESGNRAFPPGTNGPSKDMIDKMMANGAKNCQVIWNKGDPEAVGLIVELPKGKDQRKAIFDAAASFYKEFKMPSAPTDEGQKYLFVTFDPMFR